MMRLLKSRLFITIVAVSVLIILLLGIREAIRTDAAHQTFENYYAFRGCVQLIDRTDTLGHCKTADGQTITLVKFNNEWYLDGDLPMCWHNICF